MAPPVTKDINIATVIKNFILGSDLFPDALQADLETLLLPWQHPQNPCTPKKEAMASSFAGKLL